MNIAKIFIENPQILVTKKIVLRFNEIPGAARLVDAIAAGTAFYGLRFTTGKFRGKTIYCEAWGKNAEEFYLTYETNVSSDGIELNQETKNDDDWGGDYLPELCGITLTLKK